MRPFERLWQGDHHDVRLDINDVQNNVAVGDQNLSTIVSFVYALGRPGEQTYATRTYAKAAVLDGLDSAGIVVVPIVGADTLLVPAGYCTLQIWMIDNADKKYTIYEQTFEMRQKL